MFKSSILILILFINILSFKNVDGETVTAGYQVNREEEAVFKELFDKEHKLYFRIAKNIKDLGNREAQLPQVLKLGRKTFFNIEKYRYKLETDKYVPGVSPFPPEDLETYQSLTRMLQYTTLYADIIMQLPDLAADLFFKHKHWKELYDWAFAYCSKAEFLDPGTLTLYSMLKQHLYVEHRKVGYVNDNWKDKTCKRDEYGRCKKERKKPKKVLRKGPRLYEL